MHTSIAILAIALALGFDFVNGFHDTANAVATVIYSRALKPGWAITMSALLNLAGALTVGTSVAIFITKVVPLEFVTLHLIMAVLLAGIGWNVLTWWRGLPVSSSHCLLGSLVGAGIAAAGYSGIHRPELYKAIAALLVSPVLGFIVCMALAFLLKLALGNATEAKTSLARRVLPYLQICSSASVSYTHGGNDGQKTMGIITLILATQFAQAGYTTDHVPYWVIFAAAVAIALGTAIGGKRVIKTVGEKLCNKPIDPTHGLAAEFSTALTVMGATKLGVPVSTTHVLTSAVIGGTYGLHGKEHTNKETIKSVLYAWVLTLPATAVAAWLLYHALGA